MKDEKTRPAHLGLISFISIIAIAICATEPASAGDKSANGISVYFNGKQVSEVRRFGYRVSLVDGSGRRPGAGSGFDSNTKQEFIRGKIALTGPAPLLYQAMKTRGLFDLEVVREPISPDGRVGAQEKLVFEDCYFVEREVQLTRSGKKLVSFIFLAGRLIE